MINDEHQRLAAQDELATRRRSKRRRWIAGALALIVCLVGTWWFVGPGRQTSTSTLTTVTVRRTTFSQAVTSSGTLAPVRSATLVFGTSGQVQSVLVAPGDQVRRGQILARLDDQAAQYALGQAQAELNERMAALAETETISTTEADVVQALANVALARAQLQAAQATAGADNLSGDSTLALARTRQATTQQADVPAELAAARLKTQAAQVNLDKTRDSASVEKTNAQIALDAAADALASAQQRYSDAYWLNEEVKRTRRDPNTRKDPAQPESGKLTDNQVRAYAQALDAARLAMQDAERAVHTAQVAYDLARQQEVNAVKQAQQELADAQQSEATLANSTRASLASAHDLVVQNQAALLKQRASNTSSIASAQSSLTTAEARLSALQHPSSPSALAIASAEAQVAEARANLFAAQRAISATVLIAPFDAVVSEVPIAPMSTIAAATPALMLVDMHQLTVDVAVSESDIVRLTPGLAVALQPEALPGTVLSGTLQTLPTSPTFAYGAPSYPVRVLVQGAPAAVRLGMTVDLTMTTLAHPGALVVPLEAVQSQGVTATVQRLADQRTVTVRVTLGQQNETEVEVLSGVAEGDTLALPQSDANSSATAGQPQGGGLFGGPPGGGPPPPPP